MFCIYIPVLKETVIALFTKVTYRAKGSTKNRSFKGALGIAGHDNTARIKGHRGAAMQTIFSGLNQYLRTGICDKLVLGY